MYSEEETESLRLVAEKAEHVHNNIYIHRNQVKQYHYQAHLH